MESPQAIRRAGESDLTVWSTLGLAKNALISLDMIPDDDGCNSNLFREVLKAGIIADVVGYQNAARPQRIPEIEQALLHTASRATY
jgi:hypothetical protein